MRTSVVFLCCLLALCGAQASGAQRTLTIKIGAMNGSGETGTATFTAQGDKTQIVVDLQHAPDVHQPSHLHEGTCEDYSPQPAYPLADIVNGKSSTVINEKYDRVVSGRYILNVHKSYDDIATQASCAVVKG